MGCVSHGRELKRGLVLALVSGFFRFWLRESKCWISSYLVGTCGWFSGIVDSNMSVL